MVPRELPTDPLRHGRPNKELTGRASETVSAGVDVVAWVVEVGAALVGGVLLDTGVVEVAALTGVVDVA